MIREIDVKAILSHIIKGDGLKKCRICMGPTTDGFVHLNDDVIINEGKFITLSQVLEGISGVEMSVENLRPNGVCVSCTNLAVAAFEFRTFVKNSQNAWLNCFNSLDLVDNQAQAKALYLIFNENLKLVNIKTFSQDVKGAVKNLLEPTKTNLEKTDRKQRVPRSGPNCSCPDCGKEFHSPYYLNSHLKNSSQKEACCFCAAICRRGEDMKQHFLTVHKMTMFLCKDCPLLFKSEEDLDNHHKTYHKGKCYTCNECGNSFSRANSLELHTQMHIVRTCRVCGSQFYNRGCYRFHRSICEPGAKPDLKSLPRNRRSNVRDPAMYICDYCKKVYQTRPQLQNHIIWIHMDKRPHQCQWCGKRFYTSARLAEHIVVHTRERKFTCDICGVKLVSKMAVVYHRRRHTGEKPYECEDCGEKFISSSRRSDHAKRKHNKGTKLKCDLCKSTFVRSNELKRHIKKMHSTDENLEDDVAEVNKI